MEKLHRKCSYILLPPMVN